MDAQAVEEPVSAADEREPIEAPRPLPEKATSGEVDVWRGEVRTAAIAAAGGIVAGAATVALVKRRSARKLARNGRSGSRRAVDLLPIAASRSFLVDVHVIGKQE